MDDADDRTYSRAPRLEDVARIERALHDSGARYVLIGGFAVIAHGGGRTTKDIDLLVDPAPENVALVRKALSILHDDAAADVRDTEVADYGVVRIADEVVVDLLSSACGITWAEAAKDAFACEACFEMPEARDRSVPVTGELIELLLATARFGTNIPDDDDLQYVIDHGLVTRGAGGLEVANPIYQELISSQLT